MKILFGIILLIWYSIAAVHSQCEEETKPYTVDITAFATSVSSDLFGYDVPNNTDCTWLLSAATDERIYLRIADVSTYNCNDSYAEIFDGPSEDALLLGRYCTSGIEDRIVSSGSSLFVRFVRISSTNNWAGMTLYVQSSNAAYKPTCGTVLTAEVDEQFLMTTTFPSEYEPDSNCTYVIYTIGPEYGVNITMYFNDIYPTSSCTGDKLAFMAYAEGEFIELAYTCEASSLISVPNLIGDYAIIQFTTDSVDNRHGYLFSYVEIEIRFILLFPIMENASEAISFEIVETMANTFVDSSVYYVTFSSSGLITTSATDSDTGESVPFLLEEITPIPNAKFGLKVTTVDYETKETYNITIAMNSEDLPNITHYVYYNVTLIPEDDTAPTFLNLPETITIYRFLEADAEIFTVSAVDNDLIVGYEFNLTLDSNPYDLVNMTEDGVVTLFQDLDILPLSVTKVDVKFLAFSELKTSTAVLTIIIPDDSPPECDVETIETDPIDSDWDGFGKYVDYIGEYRCTDDNDVVEYSVGTVSPTVATPLFGIETDTGELYLLRRFEMLESGADRKFIVETLVCDTQPMCSSLFVSVNVTGFNCYPNPQFLYIGMDKEPGTVVSSDFNCSSLINMEFTIVKQYPSNTFEMQNTINGSYALVLKDKVYKIRFYSLMIRVNDLKDRINLKFNVVVQTVLCSPDDVS